MCQGPKENSIRYCATVRESEARTSDPPRPIEVVARLSRRRGRSLRRDRRANGDRSTDDRRTSTDLTRSTSPRCIASCIFPPSRFHVGGTHPCSFSRNCIFPSSFFRATGRRAAAASHLPFASRFQWLVSVFVSFLFFFFFFSLFLLCPICDIFLFLFSITHFRIAMRNPPE